MSKLICFGASSAQGVGDSQGGFFKRLEAGFAAEKKPRECLNFGVGGDTTADMLKRLDALRPHLPCPAIVLLGSNDLPRPYDSTPERRIPLHDFETNVARILGVFTHPQTIFVSSFAVRYVAPANFAAYMASALQIARERSMIIWDLYTESLGFGERYFCEDGIHYNDEGHAFIAGRLREMMSGWD